MMLQTLGKITLKPRLVMNVCGLNFSTTSARNVKFFDDAEEALKDMKDGATVLVGGFFTGGIPENCIRAVKKLGAKNLNVVSITAGLDNVGVGVLVNSGQIKRLITTYVGKNNEANRQYVKGEIEVELTPQGNLIEKLRAAGAGIPAFYTPTGTGTLVQHGGAPIKFGPNGEVVLGSKGKEFRVIRGKTYLLEEALPGDFALIKAWKADRQGNLIFRKSARNLNPTVAKAATVAVAEVEEIVEDIDPDNIHLPHIYVDRIFKGKFFEKKMEPKILTSSKPKSKSAMLQEKIVRRAVLELKDGMCVNLGAGIPVQVANFIGGRKVTFQSENGILGLGRYAKQEELDADLTNAFNETATVVKGASFFSSEDTFDMIRGGHLDWTILGAMQVSKFGDLANWVVPGQIIKGMGGAMDLVSSSKTKVMVAMEHSTKGGVSKIVNECTLPLTGQKVVNMIVTEMGVFKVDATGLTLTEIGEGLTVDQVKAATACEFRVSDSLKPMAQAEVDEREKK